MQILIVEDDFISRRLLSRYLEPLGICDMAINGEEAIAAVAATIAAGENYHLVCLDIMMPGIGGQEVLEEIRSLERQHGISADQACKVVMTSALEKQEIIDKAMGSSADGFVVKPIVKRKFLEVLEGLGLMDHAK